MQAMPANTIPDSKCPICLDTFDNAVYLEPCCHVFCFYCIQRWSRFKTECPVCQQPYFSLYCVDHAESDTSSLSENRAGPSENRYFMSTDQSTASFADSPADLETWERNAKYGSPVPLHDESSISLSEVSSGFSDEGNPQERQWTSSEYSVDLLPQHDETPGPLYSHSEEDGASTVSSTGLEMSHESSARGRATVQSSVNSSNSLSEHCDISGHVNLYTERTPELTELSSDSEVFIREEKREDVKKEQSIQDSSGSDRELSRFSPPLYPHASEYQVKKRLEKSGDISWSDRELSKASSPQSPHTSGYQFKKRQEKSGYSSGSDRKLRRASSPQSPHTSGYQFKKKRVKSGDGSKHQSKESRRSSSCDTCLSLKGHAESSNCESTSSSDSSITWSHCKSYGQSSSSSLDSDWCYRRGYYQNKNRYLLQTPKTAGDDAPFSKSTQSEAHCSSSSPGQEFKIQSFTERTDLQSQMEFHERHGSRYEQRRSKSPSTRSRPRSPSEERHNSRYEQRRSKSPSTRSRPRSPSEDTDRTRHEKSGGKRKCKTHHLEKTQ